MVKIRKNRNHFEHDLQVSFFERLSWQYPKIEPDFYAIPNGGKRTIFYGKWLKKEGLRAGMPDVCCTIASKGYHSLYIEFKTPGEHPSALQLETIERLRKNGHKVEVIDNIDEAMKCIEDYLF